MTDEAQEEIPKKLTPKEKAWADAYLVTLSKAGAARIAKYKGDSNTLAHVGWENYRKEYIQAYMKDKLDQMAMPANEVLARLAAMASSNLSDFASIKTSKDLEECEDGAVLKKFKRKLTRDTKNDTEYEEVELELYDAQAALVHLGKAHGLFNNDAGSSDDKPFIVKVTYGERTNGQAPQPTPETD